MQLTRRSSVRKATVAFAMGLGVGSAVAGPTAVAAQEAAKAAGAAESVESMEEIVVTAQRRSQRLQDVPISVAAFTSDMIESRGITSTRDLDQTVAGLTMTTGGTTMQPFIRGNGSSTTLSGQESGVAIYLDGVYMPMTNGATSYDFANVDSIQVLKGPQGTLFGRNSNAGAILITTKKPGSQPEGSFSASYGNFAAAALRGYVSAPVMGKVGFSITGTYDRHDGWFHSLVFNRTIGQGVTYSIRPALYLDPTDNLSIVLGLYYSHLNDPTTLLLQPSNGYLGYKQGALYPAGPYDNISGNHIGQLGEQVVGSARVIYTFDSFSATSTSAYGLSRRGSIHFDSDTLPAVITTLDLPDNVPSFSQEILFNSTTKGSLSWTAGAYYYWQRANIDLDIISATSKTTISGERPQDAVSGFGDATYRLWEFELTAGVRYNHEKASYSTFVTPRPGPLSGSKSWDSVTPRLVLAYHPTNDLLVYASYTGGFKAGAINIETPAPTILNPEKIKSYEAGVKFSPSRKLTFNGSAFLSETRDLQLQALNAAINTAQLINAGKLKAYGADFDISTRPLTDLNVTLGLELLHSEFTRFPNAQVFLPNPGSVPGFNNGNRSVIVDASGKDGVRAPNVSFNASANYTVHLADGGVVVPSVNISYTSSFYWDPINRLKEDPHVVLNSQVEWNLPDGHFAVTAWGKNLTNTLRFENVSSSTITDRRLAAMPRSYGVRLNYRF